MLDARVALIFFVSTVVSPSCANAQQNNSLGSCRTIKSEVARLNCYDALATKLDSADETTPQSSNNLGETVMGSGKWSVEQSTDPMSDQPTFTAVLTADEGGNAYRKPTLFIRCKNTSAEVYIGWNAFLSDNKFVTIRFGDQAPEGSNWSPSTDQTATFLDYSRVQQFLESAMRVETFVARTEPYHSAPITAVFDIRGMSEVFQENAEICGINNQ
jgi:type VI secretion system protein VasI